MSDWTASSRVKVKRAKKHFGELDLEIGSFFDNDAYKVVPEDEPETGDRVHRLYWLRDLPLLEWSGIAGDVIHNLRTALDVALHQLVWSKTRTRTKRAYPVPPDLPTLQAASMPDIQRCSPAVVDVIKRTECYRGGENDLWMLPELDNGNKHWELTTLATGILVVTSDVSPQSGALFLGTTEDRIANLLRIGQVLHNTIPYGDASAKDGTILMRIPAAIRDQVDMDPRPTFQVALHEPEGVGTRPLLDLLSKLVHGVDEIITDFSAISAT